MVSHALHLHPRREGALLDYVRARWAGANLDRRLAEGADPHGERLLKLGRGERSTSDTERSAPTEGVSSAAE
jgi:hypothetical protein